MAREVQIDSPARSEVAETLRLLVGGSRRDVAVAIRAEAFDRMIHRSGGGHWLLRGRRGGSDAGAALVVASAGSVGMAFCSPPDAPGVDGQCAAAALRAAAGLALDAGLSFVQTLLAPSRGADVEAARAAGFERLAELVYMRREAGRPLGAAGGDEYVWRCYGDYGEAELIEVIQSTYTDSKDCPKLCGLRAMDDVIAGHKAGGIFSPRSWWIPTLGGRSAGCVLVNDSTASPGDAELVYMGVGSAFRGRGLGRRMVGHAVEWVRQRNRGALNVAVDSANHYAKRIYDAEGFEEVDRRLALILTSSARRSAGP